MQSPYVSDVSIYVVVAAGINGQSYELEYSNNGLVVIFEPCGIVSLFVR